MGPFKNGMRRLSEIFTHREMRQEMKERFQALEAHVTRNRQALEAQIEARFQSCRGRMQALHGKVTDELLLLGRMNAERILERSDAASPHDVEFKVFSQWGEDGIIQYLVHHINIPNRTFIEFGVENYLESNTRFLLAGGNWRGLIIDGSAENVEFIKNDPLYWKHDLTALCAFVTKDNIDRIIGEHIQNEDIGLLSIDIDGNDYWVWEAIETVRPRIVICEYNSVFGCDHAVTVPYNEDFARTKAHYSNLYFGASLPALCRLGENKGYAFVGSNSTGNNAFFVRRDLRSPLPKLTAREGYVESRFRESRDEKGELTHLSGKARLEAIKDKSVYHLSRDAEVLLGELL